MLAGEWISALGFNEPAFKDRLLTRREATYELPYGMEMARGLESGVDAYFLAQDKPIAAFIARDNEQDAEFEIIDTQWDKLWNQGLANVLILYLPNKVKIYSLLDIDKKNKKLPYLIEEITDTIKSTIRQRIFSLEEGVFFHTHAKHFSEANRIDRKLLENLKEGRKSLMTCATPLSKSVSQILLLQVLFLAYLEDRGILPAADFFAATNGKYNSLVDLLYAGDVSALETLYAVLREQFNGDMFVSPGSFGQNEEVHSLTKIVFAEKNRLTLIKPYRVRHWMPSAALCDADRILEDLRLHHTRNHK